MANRTKSVILIAHLFALFLSFHAHAFDLSTSDLATEGVGIRNFIAVDQDDHFIHVVYYDEIHDALKHAILDDTGNWEFSTVDDNQFSNIFDLDLHVDSKGTAHLAYVRNGVELVYAERKGNSWYKSIIYTWTNTWSQLRQVAIGADLQGHPYIAFSEDFNYLQLAYEDRETSYPFSWTMLSPQGYRMAGGGIDVAISQPSTGADPAVNIVYRQYNANQIKLVTFDLATATWNDEVARDFGPWYPGNPSLNNNPPFSISYALANDNHHIGYLWVDDPTAPCFSCGTKSAYYIHSTPTGWSSPERLSIQGFPNNIRFLSDINISSTNEPVFVAVGANDPDVHIARKSGGTWIVESTNYGFARSVHWVQSALDACDNLHVSGHDSTAPYELEDDKLIYIAGLVDPDNNDCVIQPQSTSSGYSGYGTNRCKAKWTSWTELPRLDCDFLAHIRVKLHICHITGHPCSFSGSQGFAENTTAQRGNYAKVAGLITELLARERWFNEKEMLRLKENVLVLFKDRGLLDKNTNALIDQLSIDTDKASVVHILAKLMHRASLAESMPEPVATTIQQGEWSSASLGNMAWVSMRNVTRAGEIKLEIVDEGELVRPPGRGTVLWPAAIYRFSFSGEQAESGYSDITINFSGLGYSDPSKVRIYEVAKNFIRNMTTHVDPERGIVTGRVKRFGAFVLVEHP